MDHAGCLHRPSQTVANVTQSLETMSRSGAHLNYCSSSVAVSLRHSEVFWGLKGVLETVVLRCWLAVTVEGTRSLIRPEGDSPAGLETLQVILSEP